jgi:hypothetical protein
MEQKRAPPAGADDGMVTDEDDREEHGGGHDSKPDCWGLWYIHGRAYDLSGFMDQHPGTVDEEAGISHHTHTPNDRSTHSCIPTHTTHPPSPPPTHTGGSDALALARGRDCTALFESYHPFTDKPRRMLAKFLVLPAPPVPVEVATHAEGDGFFLPAPGAGAGTGAARVRDPFWVRAVIWLVVWLRG